MGEANCLFCHVKYSTLKLPADSGLSKALSPRKARGALIEKGFFRQAASGVLEYVQNTDGEHLLTIARADNKFALDDNGLPVLNWNSAAFDKRGRVVISMLRFPESENCMECHVTSNSRRGFYGFGADAKFTLATDGGSEEPGAGGNFEDDYRDDIHKGTSYTDDNGERRSIESCNACHSSQYYKSILANIDLDANHDFPKGNSDMDVRNDLDYVPNVKSCEECHITAINAVVSGKYNSLLHAHTERWRSNGDLKGYDEASLIPITQRNFDTVACQTCHIVGKADAEGKDLQIMYRFRIAEDGLPKVYPYNPRLRFYWKDRTSGHILVKTERNAIFVKTQDANGDEYGAIVDPVSGKILGRVSLRRVSGAQRETGFVFSDPNTYEGYIAVKQAYDSLLRKKGFIDPNVTMVWTESNEYVISHNTRTLEEAMSCLDCHIRQADGTISQQISPQGVLGAKNSKVVARVPDVRLVTEGVVSIGLPYSKLQPSGLITQNVADILTETLVDPFMSLLKNSSATEVIGEFVRIATDDFFQLVGPTLTERLAVDYIDSMSHIFYVNKGKASLRRMGAIINGSVLNNILFPTFRAALGILEGIDRETQDFLNNRGYGSLRSNVFYFDVLDSQKNRVENLNGAEILIKVAYKGVQDNLADINVVIADRALTQIKKLPASGLVMIVPASLSEEGFVIFKTKEPGYFLVADK